MPRKLALHLEPNIWKVWTENRNRKIYYTTNCRSTFLILATEGRYYSHLSTMVLFVCILGDGDLLNSVLLIQEEATEAMVKLTCPRSTSHDLWHSMGIEPRSRNSHPTSSTSRPRTHTLGGDKLLPQPHVHIYQKKMLRISFFDPFYF